MVSTDVAAVVIDTVVVVDVVVVVVVMDVVVVVADAVAVAEESQCLVATSCWRHVLLPVAVFERRRRWASSGHDTTVPSLHAVTAVVTLQHRTRHAWLGALGAAEELRPLPLVPLVACVLAVFLFVVVPVHADQTRWPLELVLLAQRPRLVWLKAGGRRGRGGGGGVRILAGLKTTRGRHGRRGRRRRRRVRRVWRVSRRRKRSWRRLGLPGLLEVEHGVEEADVADGQAQDLVLAQLLVGRVRGHEAPQLAEGRVDLLLPPSLPAVGEHPPRGPSAPSAPHRHPHPHPRGGRPHHLAAAAHQVEGGARERAGALLVLLAQVQREFPEVGGRGEEAEGVVVVNVVVMVVVVGGGSAAAGTGRGERQRRLQRGGGGPERGAAGMGQAVGGGSRGQTTQVVAQTLRPPSSALPPPTSALLLPQLRLLFVVIVVGVVHGDVVQVVVDVSVAVGAEDVVVHLVHVGSERFFFRVRRGGQGREELTSRSDVI